MPFWPFRRKETLNEKLMREAGLAGEPVGDPEEELPDPSDLEDSWFDERSLLPVERLSGEITSARPRRWDTVVSAEAPAVQGHEVEFVALEDGSLIVTDEQGDGDLTPLADAVESQLNAPYRARGVRKRDDVWAVAARKLELASFAAEGEEIELSVHDGVKSLHVDELPVFGSVPALEELGSRQGQSFVVRARRIDGDIWEVAAHPL